MSAIQAQLWSVCVCGVQIVPGEDVVYVDDRAVHSACEGDGLE